MRLLFATSIVPDGRLSSGYEIANAAIIDALRRAGVEVTVLGFTWPGHDASDPDAIVLGELEIRTGAVPLQQKLKWLGAAMMSGLPVASAKLQVVGADAVRDKIRAAGPFDGYVLNAAQFSGAFEEVFDGLPALFVAHNVEHQSAAGNAAQARDAFQRFIYAREARQLKTLEERLCARASFVFTLAEEDRAALGVGSDARSVMLPMVTRPEPAAPRERTVECDAALIGTWSWRPNRIGLDWFLDEVTPHLPLNFRIRIAGHAPPDLSAKHPGVAFVGRVPNAEDFVRSAAVVPLISRAGTGVQLKTIEAFELGLPTVATALSLRGVDYRPANCVVADDPRAFAEALASAARERRPALDGSLFHRRQIEELDRAIRRGLEALKAARPLEAAA